MCLTYTLRLSYMHRVLSLLTGQCSSVACSSTVYMQNSFVYNLVSESLLHIPIKYCFVQLVLGGRHRCLPDGSTLTWQCLIIEGSLKACQIRCCFSLGPDMGS